MSESTEKDILGQIVKELTLDKSDLKNRRNIKVERRREATN
jgi:hypothetical protein